MMNSVCTSASGGNAVIISSVDGGDGSSELAAALSADSIDALSPAHHEFTSPQHALSPSQHNLRSL